MQSPLRHFLPFGLVRLSQVSSEFTRIGLPGRLALRRSAYRLLQETNLSLLPDGALSGPPGCIIDAGANQGDWAATVLGFYPAAELICIEPDPRLVAGLKERFAGDGRVRIVPAALGSTTGTAELKLMRNPVLNSLRTPAQGMRELYPEHFAVRETVKVDLLTLDRIGRHADRVLLLKIDTQGFEREVLAGAGETLQRTDHVLLEMNFQAHYEGEAGFFELDGIMREHGFCISNYSRPKGGKRQALFADVLYVRQDSC